MASGTFFRDSLHSIIVKFWGDNLDLNFRIGLFKVKQEYISNHTTSRFNSMWFSNALLFCLTLTLYGQKGPCPPPIPYNLRKKFFSTLFGVFYVLTCHLFAFYKF